MTTKSLESTTVDWLLNLAEQLAQYLAPINHWLFLQLAPWLDASQKQSLSLLYQEKTANWILLIALTVTLINIPYTKSQRAKFTLRQPIVIFCTLLTYTITLWLLINLHLHNYWGIILYLILSGLIASIGDRIYETYFKTVYYDTHGSASWATYDYARKQNRVLKKGWVLHDFGFALGRIKPKARGMDTRLRYMGHILTCAPTGAGKGIGAVIPNLLEYPGSAVVLDIKGENYAVTHHYRKNILGHNICRIDPFGLTGEPSHRFNWLDCLDHDHPTVISQAAALADLLVVHEAGGSPHWNEAAQDLIKGLLVYVATLEEDKRHVGTLRDLLTSEEEAFNQTLKAMSESKQGFGLIAKTAHMYLAKVDKERSGVRSAAIRHTAFLDDPQIIQTLCASDFSLHDLKRKPMTLYVIMPPAKLSAYKRFMRCFVGLSLAAVTDVTEKPPYKVVFFLDEFAQLGHMQAIEDAISLVRGYHVAFWIFVQDLSQLKGVYPKWQTFLANSAKQFFGTADFDTANYLSKALGNKTISYGTRGMQRKNILFQPNPDTLSENQHLTHRPLLTPDEVMRLGTHQPIILIAGEKPYMLERLNYLNDKSYEGKALPNPMHG